MSVGVARILAIEAAAEARPNELAAEAARHRVDVRLHAAEDPRIDVDERAAAGLREQLHLAGALQVVHLEERIADRRADGEEAVVPKNEARVLAEVLLEARL